MSDATPKCGWNEAAPNIDAACKIIKLVCLGCGKETHIDATHFHDWPVSTKRLVAVYNRCLACELKFKGGPVTINEQ